MLKELSFTPSEIGRHPHLDDTSLILAINARLVGMDKLTNVSKFSTADGVYGDPTRSTAKLGAMGIDAILEPTVAAITAVVTRRWKA